jgi:hypothetical protein
MRSARSRSRSKSATEALARTFTLGHCEVLRAASPWKAGRGAGQAPRLAATSLGGNDFRCNDLTRFSGPRYVFPGGRSHRSGPEGALWRRAGLLERLIDEHHRQFPIAACAWNTIWWAKSLRSNTHCCMFHETGVQLGGDAIRLPRPRPLDASGIVPAAMKSRCEKIARATRAARVSGFISAGGSALRPGTGQGALPSSTRSSFQPTISPSPQCPTGRPHDGILGVIRLYLRPRARFASSGQRTDHK